MTSRLRNNSGFTIVELLIVIVVIGILAGLVLNTFNGIQASARDSERQTDLNAVQGHLESYFAKNGYYPTTGNIGDSSWVSSNLQGLDPEALIDPTSGSAYSFAASPSGCDNSSTECSDFLLTADLEEDGRGGDDADSDTADLSETGQAN